jgi:hypothetical protein
MFFPKNIDCIGIHKLRKLEQNYIHSGALSEIKVTKIYIKNLWVLGGGILKQSLLDWP